MSWSLHNIGVCGENSVLDMSLKLKFEALVWCTCCALSRTPASPRSCPGAMHAVCLVDGRVCIMWPRLHGVACAFPGCAARFMTVLKVRYPPLIQQREDGQIIELLHCEALLVLHTVRALW